jgi:peptidoglycan hydrolase-like protein with peptidoglycan-binding domain
VIDGHNGENVAKAVSAFEATHGLPVDGELDAEVWSALERVSPDPVLIEYSVTDEDMSQEFVGAIPQDYAEMAGDGSRWLRQRGGDVC